MVVMFLVLLILFIPLTLVGALQQHAPILGFFLQIPLMAVFTGGILALNCANGFQAWREIFGDEEQAPVPPPDVFHA
jgi:hypothetical protein